MPRAIPRRCLGRCGRTVVGRSRCPQCSSLIRLKYSGDWEARARAAVAAHRAAHGDLCPGWERVAHPATDLVLDHHVGVLCRSCNTTKRNRGGG